MDKRKRKMRKIAIAVTLLLLVIVALWAIQNSAKIDIRTVKVVSVYSHWRCGLSCGEKGKELLKLPVGLTKKVETIRLGKGFVAFKVSHDGKKGWIIGGKEIAIENSATHPITFSDGKYTVTFEGAGQSLTK